MSWVTLLTSMCSRRNNILKYAQKNYDRTLCYHEGDVLVSMAFGCSNSHLVALATNSVVFPKAKEHPTTELPHQANIKAELQKSTLCINKLWRLHNELTG